MSRADELFHSLINNPGGPVAFVEGMVTAKERETEYLDFKSGGDLEADTKEKKRSLRETWSKALSGFGNTGGGVLVFGVKASKPKDGSDFENVDHAYKTDPLEKPQDFAQRLLDQRLGATDEPVRGVDVQPLLRDDGTGYVVCLIPESDRKPHRADGSGNAYFQRNGDSFIPIPHSLLRSMFHPRPLARLRPRLLMNTHPAEERNPLRAHLWLNNEGEASAERFAVQFTSSLAWDKFKKHGLIEVERHSRGNVTSGVLYDSSRPLHPGQDRILGQHEYELTAPEGSPAARTGDRDTEAWLRSLERIEFAVTIYTSNQLPTRWDGVLDLQGVSVGEPGYLCKVEFLPTEVEPDEGTSTSG